MVERGAAIGVGLLVSLRRLFGSCGRDEAAAAATATGDAAVVPAGVLNVVRCGGCWQLRWGLGGGGRIGGVVLAAAVRQARGDTKKREAREREKRARERERECVGERG